MHTVTRRSFLGDIGYGMLTASLGSAMAGQLGAAGPRLRPIPPLRREGLEALIARMQETEADALLPHLVNECKAGTQLGMLTTAGALANARTFAGSDYEGYHAFMALLPALAMAGQMPKGLEPLPVLKVLHRNTARIRRVGSGRQNPAPVDATASPGGDAAHTLRSRVRERDLAGAEAVFVGACAAGLDGAYDELQEVVRDDLNVHRIVLAWRAWDMLRIAGVEHAQGMLRQVVHFCVDEEQSRAKQGHPAPAVRSDVPRILDQHKLLEKPAGTRAPDDAWVDRLASLVFASDRARAADAVAAALAEGFVPEAIGEAISLAGNQLLLHATGVDRVHGASIGVHASDAANAWRNVARVLRPEACMASLVTAAYHTAGQAKGVGAEPYAYAEQLAKLTTQDAAGLLRALQSAIELQDQRGACAAMEKYGACGHAAEPAFALLLRYAVSEDGALHAEKYFHTVREEFDRTRPAFRWRRLVGLARVTASEFGQPAPGVAAARKLLEA